jgi:hypothetical protein
MAFSLWVRTFCGRFATEYVALERLADLGLSSGIEFTHLQAPSPAVLFRGYPNAVRIDSSSKFTSKEFLAAPYDKVQAPGIAPAVPDG